MKLRALLVGATVLGLSTAGMVTAQADTATYAGPGIVAGCAGPAALGTDTPVDDVVLPAFGVGGACFTPGATAKNAAVSAIDTTGKQPALSVSFQDSNGSDLGDPVDVCDGAGTVAVPAGSAYMYVFTMDPVSAKVFCAKTSVPTTGSLNVTFS